MTNKARFKMSDTRCLFCNCDLTTTDAVKVATAVKVKLFQVLCKLLNMNELSDPEILPLCSNCVTHLEQISFNYNIIESVYGEILTLCQSVHEIIQNIDHSSDESQADHKLTVADQTFLRLRGSISNGLRQLQVPATRDNDVLSTLRIARGPRNKRGINTEQEEVEVSREGDFFASFMRQNVQQLWGERVLSKQREREKRKRPSTFDDENSVDTRDSENRDEGNMYDEDSRTYDDDVQTGNCSDVGGYSDQDSDDSSRNQYPYAEKRHRGRGKAGSDSRTSTNRPLVEAENGGYLYADKYPILKPDESNYKCGKCQLLKPTISEILEHIENDHLGYPLKGLPARLCHICGAVLRGPRSRRHCFVVHERRPRRKNNCRICSAIFPTTEDLAAHLVEAHPVIHNEGLNGIPVVPTTERVHMQQTDDGRWFYRGTEIIVVTGENGEEIGYKCSLCPSKGPYSIKRKVSDHIRSNHIENVVDGRQTFQGVEIIVDTALQLYSCTLCPDRAPYKARKNLVNHIKDKHLERDKPWMPCEECGKEFRTLTQLNTHRKTHQNPNYDLICDLCAKSFNSELVLKTHKRQVHEGVVPEKKFQCSECGRKFTNEKQLEIHTRLHTGELPFKCQACDSAFRAAKMLRVHFRRKHAEETPFKCNFCTEAFHDSTFVSSHLKQVHPEVQDRRKGIGYRIIYNAVVAAT